MSASEKDHYVSNAKPYSWYGALQGIESKDYNGIHIF